jgi:hypothetical protein
MFGAEMNVGNPNRPKPLFLRTERFSVGDHQLGSDWATVVALRQPFNLNKLL